MRGSRRWRSACPSARWISTSWWRSPKRRQSISWSSRRTIRWSAACGTRWKRRASAPAGRGCRGGSSKALRGSEKDLCREVGIPTAGYQRFRDAAAAKTFADTLGLPVVIKADGLALGKGVIIAETKADADKAIDFMFEGGFGESGSAVVVGAFMQGEEARFFALSDGEHVVPLAGAQDHKRAFDGDKGPNTGGMGAYSPAPVLTPVLEQIAMETFIKPTVAAMAARGRRYQGVMYLGLMITK